MRLILKNCFKVMISFLLIVTMITSYSFTNNLTYADTLRNYGYVDAANGLNVREGPGTSYDVAYTLFDNDKVDIYEEKFTTASSYSSDDIWYLIGEENQYIRSDFVDGVHYVSKTGKTTVNLNYRKGAGSSMKYVGTFKKDAEVQIVCDARDYKGTLWYKVKVGTNYYYAHAGYIEIIEDNTVSYDYAFDQSVDSGQVNLSNGLNVRAETSGYSEKLGVLANNTEINLYSEYFVTKDSYYSANIWIKISEDEEYVNSKYVDNKEYNLTPAWASRTVNYRKGAGTSMTYAGTLHQGDKVYIASVAYTYKGYKWYKIKIDGKYYYAYAGYFDTEEPGPEDLVTGATIDAPYGLNIREGTSINYDVIGRLKNGDKVKIYEEYFVTKSYYSSKYVWVKISENEEKYIRADFTENYDYYRIYGYTKSALNYRKGAGTSMKRVGTFSEGTRLEIVGIAYTYKGYKWYKVKHNGSYYYVSASYVTLESDTTPNMDENEFEAYLDSQGFPDSYKTKLIELHKKHPNWVFYAQQIDIPFEVVVDKEAVTGSYSPSLIHSIYPKSYRSVADGDYKFGLYTKTAPNGSDNSVYIYNNGEFNILNETFTSATSYSESNIWLKVNFNNRTGYIRESDLYSEEYTPVNAVARYTTNIRAGAGTGMTILGKAYEGDTLQVVAYAKASDGSNWYKVKYDGDYAYMYAANLSIEHDIDNGIGKIDKGTYYPHDATCWFTADEKAVAYYMDPRNFLDSNSIYLFEDLSYHGEYQTELLVEKIIDNCQLEYKNFDPKWFVEAGKKYDVSPVHLAARAKVETGGGTGTALSGEMFTYNGSTFSGIYNPYNIGATSSLNPVLKGLYWAATGTTYLRPWNTKEKSVHGGAQFIASGYINNNQNSIYTQKFNVANGESNVATHQYMTNITAPIQEAAAVKGEYQDLGITDEQLTFIIPVYKNMPETASPLPSSTGNNNNYLSMLKIEDYGFTKSFDKDRTTYYVEGILSSTVKALDITAFANDNDAVITGSGNVNIASGSNTLKIYVKSSSGKTRTYTIIVNRE